MPSIAHAASASCAVQVARERARPRRAGVGVRVPRRSGRCRVAARRLHLDVGAVRLRLDALVTRSRLHIVDGRYEAHELVDPTRRRGRAGRPRCSITCRRWCRQSASACARLERREPAQNVGGSTYSFDVDEHPMLTEGQRHALALSHRPLAAARARRGVQRQARHPARGFGKSWCTAGDACSSASRAVAAPACARRASASRFRREAERTGISLRERGSLQWVRWSLAALVTCTLAACFKSEPRVGSETHFMQLCSDDTCGDGLQCICGVCTEACKSDDACKDLADGASCESADADSKACGDSVPPARTCDARCERDADCKSLGSQFACMNGGCRERAKMSAGGTGSEPSTVGTTTSQCSGSECSLADAPLVMLLVDTSGSMERLPSCECTTPGCRECLPNCAQQDRARWTLLLEALTGSYGADYSCDALDRTTGTARPSTSDIRCRTMSRTERSAPMVCSMHIAPSCVRSRDFRRLGHVDRRIATRDYE